MARGVYTGSAANITVAGATTILSVRPGTTCSIEFLRVWVSFSGTATSAQNRIIIGSKVTAFGTFTGITPAKTSLIDQVSAIVSGTAEAAGTSGSNCSSEGGGTLTNIVPDDFNSLNGYLWVPTPAETITLNASSASAFNVMFGAAPSVTTGWSYGATFREV
jgi:hypothetical protein